MLLSSKSNPSERLADQYRVETLADETLRVVYVPRRRVVEFRLHLFTGLFFLAISTFMAGDGPEGFEWCNIVTHLHDPSRWLLYAFMLWGVGIIVSAFRVLFHWSEWRVTHGLIEVRSYFLRHLSATRRYTSGRITIKREQMRDSESNEITGYSWWLFVDNNETPHVPVYSWWPYIQMLRRRGILSYTMFGGPMPDDELSQIAELLSRRTGWELVHSPEQPQGF